MFLKPGEATKPLKEEGIMSEQAVRSASEQLAGELAEMRQRLIELRTSMVNNEETEQEILRVMDIHSAICSLLQCSPGEESITGILTYALRLILSFPWLALESRGSIFLVEDGSAELIMKAQAGLPEPLHKQCRRVPFGKCLCGRAALTRKIQFADSLDDRHDIEYDGISSHGHYCVPIVYCERTLGVINVYVKVGHRRSSREEEFLNAMANALAWAIECRTSKTTLREKESHLGMIMAGFEGFFYVCSKDYLIKFMNGILIERTGYDATGEVCYKVMHGRNTPCPWCEKERVLRGEITRWEMQDPRDNRWYYVVNAPLQWQDGSVARQSVMLDITEIKQVEQALLESERMQRAKTAELMESNAALKSLMKKMEQEKKGIEGRILSDVRNLVLPYVGKLRNCNKASEFSVYLDILESNLMGVISSFSHESSFGLACLTPKEMQVANLIKEGKDNKEMAKMLHMSPETIKCHRQNIRKKLGIRGGRTNLRSFISVHLK
jgi:DNA-binding CsgD family transcriptional regulator/putative methionine-R-sulfoxide reductase with GAF domain